MRIGTLVVVGVGLIGGSVSLALKRRGLVGRVIGVGRGAANMQRALALGVIDEVQSSVARAVAVADIVLLAIPVKQNDAVLTEVARGAHATLVVTDAGSTKQDFIASARRQLPSDLLTRTVPGHPIAGAELTGADAATERLFDRRRVVLTPMEESDTQSVERIEQMWRDCGALVAKMPAARHDAIFGAVSHLPHVLAFALVNAMAKRADAEEMFGFAGAGFRDFTRIAGSSAEMWRDICVANRDNLVAQIDAFAHELWELRDCISRADAVALEQSFADARAARQKFLLTGPRAAD